MTSVLNGLNIWRAFTVNHGDLTVLSVAACLRLTTTGESTSLWFLDKQKQDMLDTEKSFCTDYKLKKLIYIFFFLLDLDSRRPRAVQI